jgi:hypothetical protein
MSGQKRHGDVDSENSQAGKNVVKTMGCARKISQKKLPSSIGTKNEGIQFGRGANGRAAED